MAVDVQVDLKLQEEAHQEVPQDVLGHPKVLAHVAEAAEGDIQEGKFQELHLREVQGPLSVHGLSAEIICWGSASISRKTATFGILHLAFTTRRVSARREGIASTSIPRLTTIKQGKLCRIIQ